MYIHVYANFLHVVKTIHHVISFIAFYYAFILLYITPCVYELLQCYIHSHVYCKNMLPNSPFCHAGK